MRIKVHTSCERFLDLSPGWFQVTCMDLTLGLFPAELQYHSLGVVLHIKNGSIVLDRLYTDPRRALGLSLSQSETFFSVTHCSLT